MIPEAHDPLTETRPRFQTFVTWGFYAMIVMISSGILSKFDSLDQRQVTWTQKADDIEASIQSLRIEVMTSIEKTKYLDKETTSMQIQINELRNQLLASAGKNKHIPREE